MTERSARFMSRDAQHFQIGPSQLQWTGRELLIDVDEWSVPIPRKVRGQIRLSADRFFHYQQNIDANGRHRWGPLAPKARISVDFESPRLRWEGHGYLDSNEGDEPIHVPFHEWDWSRAELKDGSVAVTYDVRDRAMTQAAAHESSRLITARFHPNGEVSEFALGPRQKMPRGLWGVDHSIRSDPNAAAPRPLKSLEDTPFYMRSVVEQTLLGETVQAFHETLHLPRVRSGVVRWMLPWRMPRRI